VKSDIVIIQHKTGMPFSAFDVLVRKGKENLVDFKKGYQINNCRYVEHFLKTNREYIYVFSEDNGHIPKFNWINDYVNKEIQKGAKLLIMEEKELGENDV